MDVKSLFKSGWLKMYQKLSGSDLKGNIANKNVIDMLYGMMCVDIKAKECKVIMPDVALPVMAREVIDLYQTCKDNYIDGEDMSFISVESLTEALFIYMNVTRKDLKEVHAMSRYDLAEDIVRVLLEKGDEWGVA